MKTLHIKIYMSHGDVQSLLWEARNKDENNNNNKLISNFSIDNGIDKKARGADDPGHWFPSGTTSLTKTKFTYQ